MDLLWCLTSKEAVCQFTLTRLIFFNDCQKISTGVCILWKIISNDNQKVNLFKQYVQVTNFAANFMFIGTSNTTLERKDERDTDKKDRNTITRYIHYIKILVILVGTVSSLTLLLIIGREMFKLFRMSETWGNYHVAMVIPVVNNTFGDITESLYNSWGTQEHRNPLLATISFLNTSVE